MLVDPGFVPAAGLSGPAGAPAPVSTECSVLTPPAADPTAFEQVALRIKVFTRDLFTCQQPGCRKIEGNTSQLVCDHIKPHRGSELLFWDEANLQTMCKPCHDTLKQQAEQASLHHRGVWD